MFIGLLEEKYLRHKVSSEGVATCTKWKLEVLEIQKGLNCIDI